MFALTQNSGNAPRLYNYLQKNHSVIISLKKNTQSLEIKTTTNNNTGHDQSFFFNHFFTVEETIYSFF
uniref:Uncharacterized protein n=1 Tax=Anguilla anguilla TaxID=7936 RepID=A0A0E9RA34_ANGAN